MTPTHILTSPKCYNSLVHLVPVPRSLFGLSKLLAAERANDFITVMSRLCSILAPSKPDHASAHCYRFEDPISTVNLIQRLDLYISSFSREHDADYNFSRHQNDIDTDTVEGHYDLYQSRASVNTWNNVRSTRIVVNFMLLDAIAQIRAQGLEYELCTMLEHDAYKAISQASSDICASVPFILKEFLPTGEGDLASMRIGSAVSVLSPLCFAAGRGRDQGPRNQWIVQQLRTINERTNVARAGAIADLLSLQPHPNHQHH